MDDFLRVMSALYDPSRVRFIKFLSQEGRSCVCELEESFFMVQSRVSRHLKILKDAGFLEVDRAGVWAYYYLSPKSELQKSLIAEIEKLQIELPKKVSICDTKKRGEYFVSSKKRVLVLCTGNSCRSIIAEALLNAELGNCLEAFSSGVEASGKVNPNAKKLLTDKGIWRDSYHSKVIDEVLDLEFDLVVTVCDNAKERCPMFPKKVEIIHIGFEDPDGKDFSAFEETYMLIKEQLVPKVKERLCGKSL